MHNVIDLDAFPFDQPDTPRYRQLVKNCQSALAKTGLFNLEDFLKPQAIKTIVEDIRPVMKTEAFRHAREHNIYFDNEISAISPTHPALTRFNTVNHTVCADQIPTNPLITIYNFKPFINFLSEVMEKNHLFTMSDPLASVNVMAYHEGEGLNWHFDRSEFTTTLLLQAPDKGGIFEHRPRLRSSENPNYEAVGNLLQGRDRKVEQLALQAGTLNVFRGKNTAHRVTPVEGASERMIAVFSFYEQPYMRFTADEQIGFYGRSLQ